MSKFIDLKTFEAFKSIANISNETLIIKESFEYNTSEKYVIFVVLYNKLESDDRIISDYNIYRCPWKFIQDNK